MTPTPRYLNFARALAFVSGSALVACSAPTMPGSDAASDGHTVTDSSACCEAGSMDVAQQPDANTTTDSAVAETSAPDANVAQDSSSPDAAADAASDVASDVASDAVADANTCPMTAPMDGSMCSTNAQTCMYTGAGGEFTQCTCSGAAWMCFTAVPGPLPPPELAA